MYYKVVPFRFDIKTYNKMRDLAHENEITMADIVRYGVDLVLEKGKQKRLTKRDIGI